MDSKVFEINQVCSLYKKHLKKLSETSKIIYDLLIKFYTEDRIKQFKSFEEFCDDINEICDGGGSGKLLFVKYIKETTPFL